MSEKRNITGKIDRGIVSDTDIRDMIELLATNDRTYDIMSILRGCDISYAGFKYLFTGRIRYIIMNGNIKEFSNNVGIVKDTSKISSGVMWDIVNSLWIGDIPPYHYLYHLRVGITSMTYLYPEYKIELENLHDILKYITIYDPKSDYAELNIWKVFENMKNLAMKNAQFYDFKVDPKFKVWIQELRDRRDFNVKNR